LNLPFTKTKSVLNKSQPQETPIFFFQKKYSQKQKQTCSVLLDWW
jgi:hypothetical protein